MKKILLAEDNEYKKSMLLDFIKKLYPDSEIIESESYISTKKIIYSNKLDLILLDMSLPNFDITKDEAGGRPKVFAGRDILSDMLMRNIKIPVIVITQFEIFGDERKQLPELIKEIEGNYAEHSYVGTVYYNAADNSWKKDLKRKLKKIKTL
jgi:CheY-like chemotaxis protein